jgi:predicted nucleic acid-binding protein
MPGSFFDTNVLIYIASGDPARADRAEKLLGKGGAVGVQILSETANVARRKIGMSWSETRSFLSMLRDLLIVYPITVEIHEEGLSLAERHNFPVFDAMIAASALHAGCDTLWSEDMQHGMAIDGRLRIRNPFRVTG